MVWNPKIYNLEWKKLYVFFITFCDFRFDLQIITTHLTYQCPICFFHMEKLNNWVSIVYCLLNNAIFCMKKTFKTMVCQMCGTYSKTKSEIIKHYQKDHIVFFFPNCRFLDFKPLLEKAKLTGWTVLQINRKLW